MLATTEAGGDGPVQDAQVLTGVAWADTYFIKGFALVELQRTDEARAALDRAVALSPYSAAYLIERAEVSKLERKWDEAMGDFEEAEAASEFSPEDEKRRDKGQAMRGQAFVHIEQGNLDAAEKVLKACLKLDRNDARAKEELQYIEQLRAAAKP